jgi:hypothetical protein
VWTKLVSKHDRIVIDGTDMSNDFRRFGLTAEDSEEDVSGFSESGFDETLAGSTSVEFSGEAFYTEEAADILYPLFANRPKETVEVYWQPNGLADSSARAFWADCQILRFGPENQRGSVSVMPFSAKPSTEDGLQSDSGT